MITFLQYFEEKTKTAELFYHITGGDNLKSILSQGLIPNKLSNFEDISSDISQSKRSYSGVYLARDLKEVAMTAIDWDIVKVDNLGLVVVESKGYNQIFTDEDNLITAIPDIDRSAVASAFEDFANKDFKNSKLLGDTLVKFIKNIKEKFTFNEHQRRIFQKQLTDNAPVVLFRGIDKNKDVNPDQVKRFLEHYNKPDTETWFRDFFDRLGNLKLKSKGVKAGFDLDGGRIKRTITTSGNPKIAGVFRIKKDETPDILYSRLEASQQASILETAQDVVDYYGDE